ncbi:invasion protein (plasmid) [Escherichia coli]|nr:invasion protein [Escherichia coli]
MTWELILDGYSESSYSATPRFAAARLRGHKLAF